jgi:hypothetical protein
MFIGHYVEIIREATGMSSEMFAKSLRLSPEPFRLFALFAATIVLAANGASAQTIAGYAIGENRSRLEEHGRIACEYGYGEYTIGTFTLQNGTKLASTGMRLTSGACVGQRILLTPDIVQSSGNQR